MFPKDTNTSMKNWAINSRIDISCFRAEKRDQHWLTVRQQFAALEAICNEKDIERPCGNLGPTWADLVLSASGSLWESLEASGSLSKNRTSFHQLHICSDDKHGAHTVVAHNDNNKCLHTHCSCLVIAVFLALNSHSSIHVRQIIDGHCLLRIQREYRWFSLIPRALKFKTDAAVCFL